MNFVKNSTIRFIVVVIILFVYVSFLLTTNYTSQTSLQQTLLKQFLIENTSHTTSLSYFFNDRRVDMMNLASSQAIEVFYENRALGMSMEYGLKQSLVPIQKRFVSLLNRYRITQDAMYLRIALLDDNGSYLVQTRSSGQATTFPGDGKRFLNPDHRTGAVLADDESRAILVSTAYYFKGKYSGQIVAWINPEYITRHLLLSWDTSDRKSILLASTGVVYLSSGSLLTDGMKGHPEGVPFRFEEKRPGVPPRNMIGLSTPVKNTPFFLMSFAPTDSVLGNLAPRGLLVGMGILAIVIIGSGIYIERTLRRSLVLQAGLSASRQHEQEQREKNLQLETEIAERIRAEEALREANELFALFMHHSPIYVFIKEVTPIESRVLQASENFYQMTGIAGSDMTGKTMAELFPPEFAAKITADDWAVISRGEVLKLEEELNGRTYTTIKFPIVQGERTLLAGYTIDITERKQLEEQSLKAQKLESIGTLAGGIAHDFNNLLQGVFGYISLAKMTVRPKEKAPQPWNRPRKPFISR